MSQERVQLLLVEEAGDHGAEDLERLRIRELFHGTIEVPTAGLVGDLAEEGEHPGDVALALHSELPRPTVVGVVDELQAAILVLLAVITRLGKGEVHVGATAAEHSLTEHTVAELQHQSVVGGFAVPPSTDTHVVAVGGHLAVDELDVAFFAEGFRLLDHGDDFGELSNFETHGELPVGVDGRLPFGLLLKN